MSRPKLGPPPIEAMSDLAWTRVERGLFSRLDSAPAAASPARARTRWPLFVLPAFAAVAAASLLLFATDRIDRGQQATGAEAPSRVVSLDSPSEVSFGDVHITLDAASAVAMSRDLQRPSAWLERGAAWFTVAPRAGREPLVVLAADTTIRVIGTRFRVARDVERVEVEVEHGIVDVQFRGTQNRVTAGQRWTSLRPNDVASVSPPDQADAPAAMTPAASPPDEGPPPSTTKPSRPAAKPAHDATLDAARAKYDQLTTMEARDPRGALAGYIELAHAKGPWSEIALFAAARLAVDQHDPRAEGFLEQYLRRFPRGGNVADARQLLERLKTDM